MHLTGGEPSIYLDFVALCQAITEDHYLSLNSNPTHGSIVEFARSVDPARVSFINAGLHLEERETRVGHANFLLTPDLLRRAGFPIFVSIVATPAALRRFDEAVELLSPLGLFPVPKLLRETFAGRQYPGVYPVGEGSNFRELAEQARAAYRSSLEVRSERPSIDIFGDDAFVEGTPSFIGRCARRAGGSSPSSRMARCSGVRRRPSSATSSAATLRRREGPRPATRASASTFARSTRRHTQQ